MTRRPSTDRRLSSLAPRLGSIDLRTAKPEARQADPFYSTRVWIELRDDMLRRLGHRCAECGTMEGRMVVDHIIEIKDGGARLDPANLQVLCVRHNTLKGIAARAERVKRRF